MSALLQQARDALASCVEGGYVDIDGDWCPRFRYDRDAVNASIEALDTALSSAGQSREDMPDFMPVDTAPKDGTMLRLFVWFNECSLEDGDHPQWTMGFNDKRNTEIDEWHIVGWSWTHDCFVEAHNAQILGWLPFIRAVPDTPTVDLDRIATLERENAELKLSLETQAANFAELEQISGDNIGELVFAQFENEQFRAHIQEAADLMQGHRGITHRTNELRDWHLAALEPKEPT